MRPSAVIFVGNGFTIALAKHLKFHQWHPTHQLIPPPDWLQEKSKSSHNSHQPLWSKERYPDMWDAWEAFERETGPDNRTFNQLCSFLSEKKSFHLMPKQGGLPTLFYHLNDVGFQLRRYLWYYFYYLESEFAATVLRQESPKFKTGDIALNQALYSATKDWGLISTLVELAKKWKLTLVSYNYDGYLENILQSHGCEPHDLRAATFDDLDDVPIGKFRVFHPHGELGTHVVTNPANQIPISDADIRQDEARIYFYDLEDGHPVSYQFPPKLDAPDFPDLVPPGHSEEHLLALSSYYRHGINHAVSSADVIGCIGFSAAPPDSAEFSDFISSARESVTTFSIGREVSKDSTPSNQLLKAMSDSKRHKFFDISELDVFQKWEDEVFRPSFLANNGPGKSDVGELFTLALHYINSGEPEKADDAISHVLSGQESIPDTLKEAYQHYLTGEKFRYKGIGDRALESYSSALELYGALYADASIARHEVQDFYAQIEVQIANVHIKLGDYVSARQSFDSAKHKAASTDIVHLQCDLLHLEGELLIHEGKVSEGIERLNDCYNLNIQLDQHANAALCELMIGNAYFAEGHMDLAVQHYDRALNLYEMINDKRGIGMSHAAAGQAYFVSALHVGAPEKQSACLNMSVKYYESAVNSLRDTSFDELVKTLLGYAQTVHSYGDVEKAKALIDEARSTCEKHGMSSELATVEAVQANIGFS